MKKWLQNGTEGAQEGLKLPWMVKRRGGQEILIPLQSRRNQVLLLWIVSCLSINWLWLSPVRELTSMYVVILSVFPWPLNGIYCYLYKYIEVFYSTVSTYLQTFHQIYKVLRRIRRISKVYFKAKGRPLSDHFGPNGHFYYLGCIYKTMLTTLQ